jgi:hypothetical protein
MCMMPSYWFPFVSIRAQIVEHKYLFLISNTDAIRFETFWTTV